MTPHNQIIRAATMAKTQDDVTRPADAPDLAGVVVELAAQLVC
jgi:hypothetical protein